MHDEFCYYLKVCYGFNIFYTKNYLGNKYINPNLIHYTLDT